MRQLQLGMGSDDLGQALPGWSRGLQRENQQSRLRFRPPTFGHKAAGRCLECQVQAYCSLWVKSISVAADSVGPAAPGAAQ
jgi:hypothetical protein